MDMSKSFRRSQQQPNTASCCNLILRLAIVLLTLTPWLLSDCLVIGHLLIQAQTAIEDNSIDEPLQVPCGTIVSNNTDRLLVKNPHHPDPTYTKSICEMVVERANSSINKLVFRFKRLELYRPTSDGKCQHDRFSVYTDLNVPVTPTVCGNQTGKTISIPFVPPLTSLIVSVTTSDLDHDRSWDIEIGQEK